MSYPKPILKWVGGKTQIINSVLNKFPKTINNYYEPFLGGGSVLFALLSEKNNGNIKINGNIYASDLNENLIWLYKNIQKNPEQLIIELKKILQEYNSCKNISVNRNPETISDALSSQESYYFWIRKQFNNGTKNTIVSSAMMLFMNKTGFRGLYREGPNGFNVPFGNYKNPSVYDEKHILWISNLIKDVKFTCDSFKTIFPKLTANDFIYFDPPYVPENATSFVGYTADKFDLDNHKFLFNEIKKLKDKKIKFLLSNSNSKLVIDSFDENIYQVQKINCKRTINSKNPNSKTFELLINTN